MNLSFDGKLDVFTWCTGWILGILAIAITILSTMLLKTFAWFALAFSFPFALLAIGIIVKPIQQRLSMQILTLAVLCWPLAWGIAFLLARA